MTVENALERLAVAVLRHRRAVLSGWLALCLVGAVLAAGLPGRIVPGGEAPASSESEAVARTLAGSPLPSLFLAVRAERGAAADVLDEAVRASSDAARTAEGVTSVTPLPQGPAVDEHGRALAVLSVATTGGTDGAIRAAHRLQSRVEALDLPHADVHVGGYGAYRDQLIELSRSDLERAERIGLPIVFVVLLVTFGSFFAAGLPLVIALSALLMGLGAVGACAMFLPLGDFVTNAASMIGIALGVDYAMFLVQRVRELLREGLEVDDAVRVAMGRTGAAVLWSGLTVLVAEATLLLVDSRSIRSAALGMVLVTAFAVLTALVVAPVVISLLGRRITRSARLARPAHRRGWWERWAQVVTRRGGVWLAGSAVVLLALGIPIGGLSDTVHITAVSRLPADVSVRQAYETAAAGYGPGLLSPVVVVVPAGDRPDVARAVAAIREDSRVAAVTPQVLPDGATVLSVTSRTGPYEQPSRDLVTSLQEGELRSRLVGIDYAVGGDTAASADATRGMFDALPKVGLVLLVAVAALLLCALRTVFLPLKAVLLVVLSLAASLGTLVLLVTTTWGARLLGVEGPSEINPIVPVTVMAITVALSTDYEVMLMARIGEEYARTGDNRRSVVAGVARTGGVITSAAVIMIAVFFGFALADLEPLKHMGVGLGLAVLLDATVVRGILVPAAMAVMGDANWWWPGRARVSGTTSPAPLLGGPDTAPAPAPAPAPTAAQAQAPATPLALAGNR